MGLIRDGIGKALGADQVQTGFNGPMDRFSTKKTNSSTPSSEGPRRLPPKPDNQYYSDGYGPRDSLDPSYDSRYSQRTPSPGYGRGYQYDDRRPTSSCGYDRYSPFADAPPAYGTQQDNYSPSGPRAQYDNRQDGYADPYDGRRRSYYDNSHTQDSRSMRSSGAFRPLALPQIEYGDGKPFLRGYSIELRSYGIGEEQFIQILDQVNKSVIPNPENVIFQKAANIAGYFVPGAASIGLIAGQFAVGIGSAVGHLSMVAKTLSKANLELFIPNGLEICIGWTKDVEKEACYSAADQGYSGSYDPEQKIAQYGNALAPLSVVYPKQQHVGRQDPIAMLGRGIGARDNQRKMKKANKEESKGKSKSKKRDAVSGGLKWLIVRKATPDSIAHWEQTLKQSEAALAEEQRQRSGR